jgi:type I restriction enzyme S subunit
VSYQQLTIGQLAQEGAANVQTGPFGTQLRASDYSSEGVPVINVRNIGYGDLRSEKIEFVPEQTADRLNVHILSEGDIVFGRKGAVDRHLFVSNGQTGWMQGSDCIRLRLNREQINPRFASYAFLRPYHREWMLQQCENKATMASLNQDVIRRIVLPFPRRDRQDEIVCVLAAYDDLIENNRRRIALLEEAARMLYREWFVCFRFPGHEHAKIIDGLPEGWEKRRVKKVCEFLGRGISPQYDDEGQYTVVNQKCIRGRLLSLGPARRQRKEFKSDRALKYLDVLINSTGTGTLGRVAQCWLHPEAMTFDSHITVARPAKEIDPFLFGYSLMELEKAFEGMGEGATNQKELSKGRIGDVQIIFPPRMLQKQFADFAENATKQIQVLSAQIEKLTVARDLLLPRLMNGEIAV